MTTDSHLCMSRTGPLICNDQSSPAHLIFSVFVDLEHLVGQLVSLEAFAVKYRQTEVT